MSDQITSDERIQAMADILSLVAIVGRVDKAAIQRVLISLGSSLFDVQTAPIVDREIARKLLIEVAREGGDDSAIHIASDLAWVARAWRPTLDEYLPIDPYRPLPYAEVLYALANFSGVALQQHDAFARFGGPDQVLPLPQLTTALSPYPLPKAGLRWEMVGFNDPPDQALIASDSQEIYLFKAASSALDLRFSELERGSDADARREHDVKIDSALFAAFIAGLIGDMLYWAARVRSHTLPGHELWRRIQALLVTSDSPDGSNPRRTSSVDQPAAEEPTASDTGM